MFEKTKIDLTANSAATVVKFAEIVKAAWDDKQIQVLINQKWVDVSNIAMYEKHAWCFYMPQNCILTSSILLDLDNTRVKPEPEVITVDQTLYAYRNSSDIGYEFSTLKLNNRAKKFRVQMTMTEIM